MTDKDRAAALARRAARMAADLARAIGRPAVYAPAIRWDFDPLKTDRLPKLAA